MWWEIAALALALYAIRLNRRDDRTGMAGGNLRPAYCMRKSALI